MVSSSSKAAVIDVLKRFGMRITILELIELCREVYGDIPLADDLDAALKSYEIWKNDEDR